MLVAMHGRALEYDLMTLAGMRLEDLGGQLTMRMLLSFAGHLPPDSATSREIRGDGDAESTWQSASLLPMLMAELVDTVHVVAWEVAQQSSEHDLRSCYPDVIERPGVVPRKQTRHFGTGAIPISDFDAWWDGGTHGKR